LLARSIVDKNKIKDEVDEDAESLYHDRDVIGQPRDWKNVTESKSRNVLPTGSSDNLFLILAAVFMIWILLRMGSIF